MAKAKHPPGDPMTLGNMRHLGVQKPVPPTRSLLNYWPGANRERQEI